LAFAEVLIEYVNKFGNKNPWHFWPKEPLGSLVTARYQLNFLRILIFSLIFSGQSANFDFFHAGQENISSVWNTMAKRTKYNAEGEKGLSHGYTSSFLLAMVTQFCLELSRHQRAVVATLDAKFGRSP